MELQGSHRFAVRYEDDVLRDAIRTFVVQRTVKERRMLWGVAALTVLVAAYLFMRGGADPSLGILALVVACFPLGFSAVVWRVHSASVFGRYRRMMDRRADITIDPEGFGIKSSLGSGKLTWPNITEIWERPHAFMLFSGSAAFNVVPRATMPQDVQDYLSAHAIRR